MPKTTCLYCAHPVDNRAYARHIAACYKAPTSNQTQTPSFTVPSILLNPTLWLWLFLAYVVLSTIYTILRPLAALIQTTTYYYRQVETFVQDPLRSFGTASAVD